MLIRQNLARKDLNDVVSGWQIIDVLGIAPAATDAIRRNNGRLQVEGRDLAGVCCQFECFEHEDKCECWALFSPP